MGLKRNSSLPLIQEPSRKRSIIEEHWTKYGSFELTSVVQVSWTGVAQMAQLNFIEL